MDTQPVVILDFGSQYTQLIARRIREQNVFSVVLPCTAPLSEIQALHPIGIILSGGPSSVYDADAPAADPQVLALDVPTLGVCYGLHFIVHHLGGKVRSAPKREYGHAEVTIEDRAIPLFAELPPSIQVWMSHGDEADQLPEGFRRVAVSENALAAIANEERRTWAVQFHPEVHHTPLGKQLIKNFLKMCGARGDWTPAHFIESTVASIRQKVFTVAHHDFSREITKQLVDVRILTAIPGIGAIVGIIVDTNYMRSVGWAARHAYQLRWLSERSRLPETVLVEG